MVGTIANKGLKRLENSKTDRYNQGCQTSSSTSSIPAADSTYVVTFEVPAMAPTEVATRSE